VSAASEGEAKGTVSRKAHRVACRSKSGQDQVRPSQLGLNKESIRSYGLGMVALPLIPGTQEAEIGEDGGLRSAQGMGGGGGG
jgi:hypothetical protein